MSPDKPRRLGRGLEALLAARQSDAPTVVEDRSALRTVPLSQVRPNPYQPRKEFKPEELADLEASLKSTGLLQPITVRQIAGGGGYELIAGERRFRAAGRLGWTEIPAIVKEIDDQTLLTLALVENLQRADLNPLEEAEGYQRLVQDFALTQQQVADIVGKDRTTVANMLRLLGLPAGVRRMLQDGEVSHGHARALLGLSDEHHMVSLAREVHTKGLSVREVERRVREAGGATRPRRAGPTADAAGGGERAAVGGNRGAELRHLEDALRRQLQTDVAIALSAGGKGEIRIAFYSAEDLERVVELLGTRLD